MLRACASPPPPHRLPPNLSLRCTDGAPAASNGCDGLALWGHTTARLPPRPPQDKGWRQVKLYFMIGLPGETDADVMGIAETVEWLQRECRQGKWHLAVNVTIRWGDG